jgi:hypothetical protein
MSAPVVCPHCSSPIAAAQLQSRDYVPCLHCQAPLLVRVFPALLRAPRPGVSAERVTDAGQATCFYHPNKTAHVPCDACGRFICALCEVELHGQHLCPSCVESGRRKGTLTTLESRRVLWDSIALSVAVLPVVTVVLWWTSIVAAPAAIFLAIYGWRKPRSVAPRSSIRFIAAIVFSVIVLGGWGTLFFYMATRSTMTR